MGTLAEGSAASQGKAKAVRHFSPAKCWAGSNQNTINNWHNDFLYALT
jgi:hypothetical protein